MSNPSISSEVIVAMACREYGEGRIFLHTDRQDGVKTGHGANSNRFWRSIFEWSSNKRSNELIKAGLVISTKEHAASQINSYNPITVKKLGISDLSTYNLSTLNCLYFAGLPQYVSSVVAEKLRDFVSNGGGIIIEYPNNGGQYINVLSGIENVYCYSSERLTQTYAYWTIDGGNHYVYDNNATMAFMSTMRQSDFSSAWTILMTNIQNVITTTTTTGLNYLYSFDKNSMSDFAISYTVAMQNGIVTVESDI